MLLRMRNSGDLNIMLHINALTPLPPENLMARVAGSPDGDGFDASGARTMLEWSNALGVVGKSFRDFPRILDFGCGCGRVLRHLRPALKPDQELFGADVDHEAVDWISNNYPGITGVKFDLLPPSKLADASIDLVVNQSVFTHLPEEVQFAWLAELHRVVKVGGILILSFHGRNAWRHFTNSFHANGHVEHAKQITERFNRRGFFYAQGRNHFEQELPEYYGSAFHTIEYIEEEWLRYFACRAWLPVFSLSLQDVVVLERI